MRSFWRFILTFFGLLQGKTERAADALVASSPDTIRSQFRVAKEKLKTNYDEMRKAVAELVVVQGQKSAEIRSLEKSAESYSQQMAGAIARFKDTQDERYRELYAEAAANKEESEARKASIHKELEVLTKQVETYKERLSDMEGEIERLNKEEAETVADIVSSRKITELNDRLSRISTDTDSKNLQAIREAREKAKATAALSDELSPNHVKTAEKELIAAGRSQKYMDAFESEVLRSKVFGADKGVLEAKTLDAKPLDVKTVESRPTESRPVESKPLQLTERKITEKSFTENSFTQNRRRDDEVTHRRSDDHNVSIDSIFG